MMNYLYVSLFSVSLVSLFITSFTISYMCFRNEVYLLPKTPSAKAASRRRRRPSPAPSTETQVEENGILGAR